MDQNGSTPTSAQRNAVRRRFLKTSGKAALAAPAAVLLLSAASRDAHAIDDTTGLPQNYTLDIAASK